jgi:hypothetical protein
MVRLNADATGCPLLDRNISHRKLSDVPGISDQMAGRPRRGESGNAGRER